MIRRASAPLVLVAILIACSGEPVHGTATVTVDVFSGVPNPSWVLDPEQTTDLTERWGNLTAAPPADHPAVLGYRGMIVGFADGFSIRVSGGLATAESAGEAETRRDPGRGFERWLLETGTGVIDPTLLDELRAQIGG